MRDVNRITLIGDAGRDPDIQTKKDGTKVGHLSVSTVRRTLRADGVVEERKDWHRIEMRGKLGQFAEDEVRNGQRLYIEGSLEYDSYERDGICIPTATVVARAVVVLRARPAAGYAEEEA